MINFLKDKKVFVVSGVFLIVILILIGLFLGKNQKDEILLENKIGINEETNVEGNGNFYVDVKGAVKDPGVYLVSEGERVIDAIEKAGGLKKNANTTNINLSKRLVSEMVIVVYTDSEIKKGKKSLECDTKCECEVIEINNCIESETKVTQSDKVNINKASIEELMTLTGVGESKAKAIVDYREENGNFKSIEEIKNVSGIGDALYENIKEGITI